MATDELELCADEDKVTEETDEERAVELGKGELLVPAPSDGLPPPPPLPHPTNNETRTQGSRYFPDIE